MKRNIIAIATSALCVVLLGGCTKNFENYNTNKHEATNEQMGQDNLFTGALFLQMQRNVIILADGNLLDSDYQISFNLNADTFSGYFAPTNSFGNNGNHSGSYNMKPQWNNAMFNMKYNGTMSAYQTFKKKALELGQPEVAALGDVVKVLSMHMVTDYYGPIPYTKFGESLNAVYDDQKTVYTAMLTELDKAIDALNEYHNAGYNTVLGRYDYVYNGDVVSWIKLANTLRLRLAMRIRFADAALARQEAEKSMSDAIGVMTAASDMAKINHGSITYHHPIWEIAFNFNDGDIHMGASMDSYMNGYKDPRIGSYWTKTTAGTYVGVRQGIHKEKFDIYGNKEGKVSSPNMNTTTNLVWMTASEAYFLRAEGALKGWNMGGTAAELYNKGIETSFEEVGVSGAADYLANNVNKPAAYKDPDGKVDIAARGTVTVKWDDSASEEVKLERIITQKWLAIYPNGCEAWAEFRRTGYPKLFPVVNNDSNGTIDTEKQVRRIPYPETEYDTNPEEVAKGVALLGGPDNGGTKLWWDKK